MEAVEVSAEVTEADLLVVVNLLHYGVKTIAMVEDKIEAVEVSAGVNGVDPAAVVDIPHHGVKTIVIVEVTVVAMMGALAMAIKDHTMKAIRVGNRPKLVGKTKKIIL
jgi:hypothetical protein